MSSSSVTSGVVGERGVTSKCVCGLGVTIFTSKTQENPGRPFFHCVSKRDVNSWTTKKDNHLFKWVEDAVFEEVEDALPRVGIMANEISKVKSEANELKAMIQALKDEEMISKMELHKCQVCFKLCFVWLCVMTIMLVYVMYGQRKEKNRLFVL
ncbi:PREDICTED: uncharacterized protein At1g43920, Chloroplastic-like [Camelina sativa]|uniref:Uncharacterized protein At1g43920, Chloroplastic-like n=1 Tax=Camelina sativa TaxID=90675 RepID=A0ABM0VIU1_CAMSA|nr:PREDICTED: uncharacterized protein At1g43920, Chloroplastic-like [Camelina sativa]